MEHFDELPPQLPRTWSQKFRNAFHGTKLGIWGQTSFIAHFALSFAVIVTGALLRVTLIEWCILLICITGVLTAEMFNSALESMARAITHQRNPHLGGALDIGSAAVLFASGGTALIGGIIFANRLGIMMGWWLAG